MITKLSKGYLIRNKDVCLRVVVLKENIIRFAYSKDGKLPQSTPGVIYDLEYPSTHQGETIITEQLKIKVDPNNLTITIINNNGDILSKDLSIDTGNLRIKKQLLWEKGIYGIGEKYGFINKLGSETVNWNSDVLGLFSVHNSGIKEYHTSIPFYIGMDEENSYGIYLDNSHRTYFDFACKNDQEIVFGAKGGNLDYYFIYNKEISKVVEDYSKLTGTMPMVRKEFLGYQQCRWSYENRQEVMEIATRMRKENVPCDIIYLDIDYMKDYKVFTVDSEKFHGFRDMLKELKEMGFKVVVIIDPGIKVEEGYRVYDEAEKQDYLVKNDLGEVYVGAVWPGPAAFPDFLSCKVRRWWGELHRQLIEDGIEGIWNDMNEPSDFTTNTKTLPENCIHRDDEGNEKSHSEVHNLYGLLMAQAAYNGLLKINPDKRPFVLTRAAYAGNQRYSALWTGDNASLWEHMEMAMPMFLNLSLSGYSFIGGDVGGFCNDSNGELLARWTQLGAFMPFFRNHSAKGTIHQEPWSFGDKYLDIIRKYINTRYSLITYIYNLMVESSKKGSPVLRPLFYHYQEDKNTYNINDQFMLGSSIMICPVTKPKTDVRLVYLPEGQWYDFHTAQELHGGGYVIKNAPLDMVPAYIKCGSIIPKDEVRQYIDKNQESLEMKFFLGESCHYDLYIDDGHSFEYKKGKYSIVRFSMDKKGKSIAIKSKIIHNGYPIPKINVKLYGITNQNIVTLNQGELKYEALEKMEFQLTSQPIDIVIC
jgi:alpha-glucosidase